MPWPHYPNKNVFSDHQNPLYNKSASLRCDSSCKSSKKVGRCELAEGEESGEVEGTGLFTPRNFFKI